MLKFITIIFIVVFAFLSCSPLGDNTGNNTLVKELPNQRRDKKVILFLKEAGTTVADSYQVTVTDNSHKFDKAEVGNTFIVDTNHNKTQFDSASIYLTWVSDNTLQIDYDNRLRTFAKETNVNGVTIVYKMH